MRIKKIGHCCLVIETKGLRIMTDPGGWTTEQTKEKNIEIILITHEHADHLHVESLKQVLKNNPDVHIYTNSSVAMILDENNIKNYSVLEDGQNAEHSGIALEGHGDEHAEIYKDFGRVQNTGYLIDYKLFYPGDAFTDPETEVEVLALPVSGPWMAVREAVSYAKKIKPKKAFPVHDGYLKIYDFLHGVVSELLSGDGIDFKSMFAGDEEEF